MARERHQRGAPTPDDNLGVEAEMAVLGAMMIESAAVGRAMLHVKADDFKLDHHRAVFEAIAHRHEQDPAAGVDITTVAERLRAEGKIEMVGGGAYLADLLQKVSTAAHVEHYAKIVRDASLGRKITAQFRKAWETQDQKELRELVDLVNERQSLGHGRIWDFRKDLAEIVEAMLEKKAPGIDTGFPLLDEVLCGTEPGDVVLVGARTSGGKTAMMTRWSINVAQGTTDSTEIGEPTLYCTTEMRVEQMVQRIMPMATGIPAWKFRRRRFTPRDIERVNEAASDSLHPLPYMIYGKPRMTVSDVRAAIVRAQPKVAFVDYIQRIKLPHGESRAYELEEAMVELKTIAQETQTVIVIGVQLDRQLDKTPTVAPTLSDLRGSGALEHEADTVILLWKPPVDVLRKRVGWTPPAEGLVEIEAVVAKNRNGAAGVRVPFTLDGDIIKMAERAAGDDAPPAPQTRQRDMAEEGGESWQHGSH